MAYFQRGDERDQLIRCNICGVNVAERSLIVHKTKCAISPLHGHKLKEGKLERCPYDSCHFYTPAQKKDHFEFCVKYQGKLLSDYQEKCRASLQARPDAISAISKPDPLKSFEPANSGWNNDADNAKIRFSGW